MTTEELKKYIYHVYLLEKQKYTIQSSYASLQNQIKQSNNVIEQNRNVKLASESDKVSIVDYVIEHIFFLLVGGYFIGGIGYLVDMLINTVKGVEGYIDRIVSVLFIFVWPIAEFMKYSSFGEWSESWCAKLLVVFGVIITIIIIVAYCMDRKDTKKTNMQNATYNKSLIFSSKQAIKEKEDYIKMVLQPECDYLTKIYKNTSTILHNLYSMGIIGEKYRNLVAVSSFYEYLEYGRCDSLTGPHGAYNKFEDELYKKIIIGKLDDISLKLDEIRNNQIMIYHAIEESKQQTEALLSELQRQNNINNQQVVEALDQINYNVTCIRINQESDLYLQSVSRKYHA